MSFQAVGSDGNGEYEDNRRDKRGRVNRRGVCGKLSSAVAVNDTNVTEAVRHTRGVKERRQVCQSFLL